MHKKSSKILLFKGHLSNSHCVNIAIWWQPLPYSTFIELFNNGINKLAKCFWLNHTCTYRTGQEFRIDDVRSFFNLVCYDSFRLWIKDWTNRNYYALFLSHPSIKRHHHQNRNMAENLKLFIYTRFHNEAVPDGYETGWNWINKNRLLCGL